MERTPVNPMNTSARNVVKLVLGTLGFFGLLVAVQLILIEHNQRLDLTAQKTFTLSPRAKQVVSALKRDVQVTAFIHSDRPENFFIKDMLSRMAVLSPHFRHSVIDINRNPALAREYNATQYGTLVFESEGLRKGTLLGRGEAAAIAALLQVTRAPGDKIIYFLTGHGEASFDDSSPVSGYTKLRGALVDEFYDERTLSLGESGTVPDDATVVVVFGPEADFLPFELEALSAYIQRGGALLVLLDPGKSPSFVTFLERYGITLPHLIAVDPTKRLFAGEMLTFRATATKKPHPLIRSVNAPPIFSLAGVVEMQPDEKRGLVAQAILATSPQGWASEPENIPRTGIREFDEEKDFRGPVPLAGEMLVQTGKAFGRIVVFGDADFLNNNMVEQGGNRDLFVNAVNWMADDPGQMAARPETQQSGVNQLFLTSDQIQYVLVTSTVVLPGSFLLIGVGIFTWRRYRG